MAPSLCFTRDWFTSTIITPLVLALGLDTSAIFTAAVLARLCGCIFHLPIEDVLNVAALGVEKSSRELVRLELDVDNPTRPMTENTCWFLRRVVSSAEVVSSEGEVDTALVRSSDDDVVPSAPSVVYVVRYLIVGTPEVLFPIPAVLAASFPVLVYGVRRRFGCSRIVVEVNVAEESKVLR
jgi:hypothetical protein